MTYVSARSILVLSATAALMCLSLSAQTVDGDAQNISNEVRAGNFAQAISDANHILASHPKNCGVLTLRGIALMQTKRTSDARHSFAMALDACPQSLPALEGAAQIDYAEHASTAAAILQRILALQPNDMTSHAMLGALAFQQGNCASAVEHFERSRALIQQNEEALREYGECLLLQGDQAHAQELFHQIYERNPSEPNGLRLAYAQWKSKQLQESLQTLQPLLRAEDVSGHALFLAAQIAEDTGDTPHAVEWLRAAIVKAPSDPISYLLFATISFNHESYQVGVDVVNAGLQRIPGSAKLYLARGVLEVQLSHFPDALADFQKAHTLDPKLSFVQDAMVIIRSQQHDAGSLAMFEKQAAEHPKDPLLQYLFAEALSESDTTGNGQIRTKAIAALTSALRLEPEYQPARDLLCTLLLRNHDYAGVLREAKVALQNDPTDQVALYQELQAEGRLGHKEAVATMVARLSELKKQASMAQTHYLLTEPEADRRNP